MDWLMIDNIIRKQWFMNEINIIRPFQVTCYLSNHALLRRKSFFRTARKKHVTRSSIRKLINVFLSLKSSDGIKALSDQLETSLTSQQIAYNIE